MRLDVVCAPTELPIALAEAPGATCAVIDVVRATTTLLVMAERGARRVYVTATVAAARDLAPRVGALLAGEEGGLRPEGFDFGNSPDELRQASIAGRDLALATTNGTRTLVAARDAGAGTLLIAALRNAGAVAVRALATAADATFLLVCAGRGGRVALDDLYTAGTIVALARRLAFVRNQALELGEGALIAARIAETAGEPFAVLASAGAGQALAAVGLGADLALCAELNVSDRVPHVVFDVATQALVVEFTTPPT